MQKMLLVSALVLSTAISVIHCVSTSWHKEHHGNITVTDGNYGCDVSTLILPKTFDCLMKEKELNLVIIRAYRSDCQPDSNAIHTIANAKEAGIPYIDVYMFPSPKCSKTASQQVKEMVDSLEGENYGQIWLDIEGSQYWLGSESANRNYFAELLNATKRYGKTVGVYSSASQWSEIMGSGYTGGSTQKLWYAHYDDNASFSDFVSFGGWTRPVMKQYAGDVQKCGADIDENWSVVVPP